MRNRPSPTTFQNGVSEIIIWDVINNVKNWTFVNKVPCLLKVWKKDLNDLMVVLRLLVLRTFYLASLSHTFFSTSENTLLKKAVQAWFTVLKLSHCGCWILHTFKETGILTFENRNILFLWKIFFSTLKNTLHVCGFSTKMNRRGGGPSHLRSTKPCWVGSRPCCLLAYLKSRQNVCEKRQTWLIFRGFL